MEPCRLQMTHLLVTCAVKRVVCILTGCVRQVQNFVTQAWAWKGEELNICQIITACMCLFEKTSLCFQKPPAVDQFLLKYMLRISEMDLWKSCVLNFLTGVKTPSLIYSFVRNLRMCKYCEFTSSICKNQVADWMFNSLTYTCDPMALSCTAQRTFTSQLEQLLKAMGNVMDKRLGTSKQEAWFVHTMAVMFA